MNFSTTVKLCIATTFSMNEIQNYEEAYENAFYWPMFQRWCIWCKCIFLRFCKFPSFQLQIFSCLRESVMFTFKKKIYVTRKSAWHHSFSVRQIFNVKQLYRYRFHFIRMCLGCNHSRSFGVGIYLCLLIIKLVISNMDEAWK